MHDALSARSQAVVCFATYINRVELNRYFCLIRGDYHDEAHLSSPSRILFVDDESNILTALKQLLVDETFEILTARSGNEALEILRLMTNTWLLSHPIKIPQMNGAELLDKAKVILPDACRIIMTESMDIQTGLDIINRGSAYRFIAKPWNDHELIFVIRDAAYRYNLLNDNKRLSSIVHRQNAELEQCSSQLGQIVQKPIIDIENRSGTQNINIERLNNNFHDCIAAFAGLIEIRDKKSLNHSQNVAEIAKQTASDFDIERDEVDTIHTAALVHDIGKIGMSDIILVKSFDIMTREEKQEYLLHPVRGQAALDSIEDLRQAGNIIRSHHETFDGTGFPDQLKGNKIPLGARIIAAADFFDRTFALHQGSNALDLSWSRLKKEEGKMFDPEVCKLIEKRIRKFYTTKIAKTDMIEIELSISDISVGMQLAQDVRSGTGLLLLSKGSILNTQNLPALRRYHHLDPSKSGIYVWSKR